MKKTFKFQIYFLLLILVTTSTTSCKKEDDENSSGGNANLTIVINGENKSFSMSDPDWNYISDKVTCFPDAIFIEQLQIGNFSNGTFNLSAGNETIKNKTYSCQQNAQDYCATPDISINPNGDLENTLEEIYNEPIGLLEPVGSYKCTISRLTPNTVSVNWAGKLQVKGFGNVTLGTYDATFIAVDAPIEDER